MIVAKQQEPGLVVFTRELARNLLDTPRCMASNHEGLKVYVGVFFVFLALTTIVHLDMLTAPIKTFRPLDMLAWLKSIIHMRIDCSFGVQNFAKRTIISSTLSLLWVVMEQVH